MEDVYKFLLYLSFKCLGVVKLNVSFVDVQGTEKFTWGVIPWRTSHSIPWYVLGMCFIVQTQVYDIVSRMDCATVEVWTFRICGSKKMCHQFLFQSIWMWFCLTWCLVMFSTLPARIYNGQNIGVDKRKCHCSTVLHPNFNPDQQRNWRKLYKVHL